MPKPLKIPRDAEPISTTEATDARLLAQAQDSAFVAAMMAAHEDRFFTASTTPGTEAPRTILPSAVPMGGSSAGGW